MTQQSVEVVIAFHSGYGHTRRLAQAAADGVASVAGAVAHLLPVESIDDEGWRRLDAADAVLFGSPTYMGGPSAPFKTFADASAKAWALQRWRDKLAGGFTCSLNLSGDKFLTLTYFVTLAMQHGMVWVGTATMPATDPGDPDAQNRIGSFIGVMAQADNVPPEQSPPPGDLAYAHSYGARIAGLARDGIGRARR